MINSYVSFADDSFTTKTEEAFIDLKNDLVPKCSFSELKLPTFWISLLRQYPKLGTKAIRLLLPFGSSYLCELGIFNH
jgi:hypothetical protein